MRCCRGRAALATAITACALPAAALPEKFVDAEDGQLDLSDYLLRYRGALPIPIIVTEPAVGYGGGLALAYFSQSFEEQARISRERGERVEPPDISILAGLKTENGTWAGGAAYAGFWDQDRWRYVGGVGKVQLHLDYFSVSGDGRAYVLDGKGLIQQLLRRVGETHWFAGARYVHLSSQSRFDRPSPDDVPRRELDTSIGKLGFVMDYDARDNIFTPNGGSFAEMEMAFARGAFGSDSQYQTLYARGYHWQPLGDFVLGVRGDARISSGDVPFYAQPYIDLRGVPAARYQDKNTLVAEVEARWNLNSRWALVAFGGAGKAYGRRQTWDEAKTVGAGGVGFRYLIARKLGMYAGLDVAHSATDSAVYITAGSAWR